MEKKFLQKNYKLYKSEIKTFSENGNRRVVLLYNRKRSWYLPASFSI